MSISSGPTLFVTDEGSGDPVVLLHGLGGTTSMWQPQAEALSATHRMIRVDHAGAGRSPRRGPLSIGGWSDDVVGVLDALDLDEVTLVVHSLSTLVAAELALRHPGRIRCLVAIGPVRAQPDPVKAATRTRARTVREDGMAAVIDGVLDAAVSPAARRDQPLVAALIRESLLGQDPEGYAASCEALADAAEPAWNALTMPVWLVAGTEDRLAAPALVDAIAAELPHATRRTVPAAGHWLSVEQPGLITEVIRTAAAR